MTRSPGTKESAPQPDTTERLQAPSEIAKQWSIEGSVVQRLIESGQLEAMRIGDEWRVTSRAVTRYLARVSNRRGRDQRRRALRWGAAAVAISAVLAAAGLLYAQSTGQPDSTTMPYTGYLELEGVPVDGPRYLNFCIAASTEGACLWNEGHTVDVNAGHFAVALGSNASLDDILDDGGNLYVGVSVSEVDDIGNPVGTPVTLAGRQLLGSVPFARRGAPGKEFVADGVIRIAPPATAADGATLSLESNGNSWNLGTPNGTFQLAQDDLWYLRVAPGGDIELNRALHAPSAVIGEPDGGEGGAGTAAHIDIEGNITAERFVPQYVSDWTLVMNNPHKDYVFKHKLGDIPSQVMLQQCCTTAPAFTTVDACEGKRVVLAGTRGFEHVTTSNPLQITADKKKIYVTVIHDFHACAWFNADAGTWPFSDASALYRVLAWR